MAADVLLTGFEPFGGLRTNPSEAVLAHVGRCIGGLRVHRAVLPVDSLIAPAQLSGLLETHRPRRVVLLGVAQRRTAICLETRARNVLDFRVPDNAGRQPQAREIVPGGAAILGARYPLPEAMAALEDEHGGLVRTSDDAGEYLCNQVFYHALSVAPSATEVVFVHLPPDERLGEALGVPHVALRTQAAVVRALATWGLG